MAGIKTCGSVWTCAVCSAKICRHRGAEIQAAIDAWMLEGGVVWMVTATIPHHAGHRLEVVLDAITRSWQYLKAGEPWQRWAERIHYAGAIKGSEATHGAAGWHPHVHALLFLESDPGPEVEADFLEWMRGRWARKVESFFWDPRARDAHAVAAAPLNRPRPEGFVSLFGRPHPEHGIRITKANKAGAYVAKMGLGKEVSVMDVKGARKGNRTPWRILRDYLEHESVRDAAIWREWSRSMKGRAHLVWSPGLRSRVAPSQLELSDDHLAAALPKKSVFVLEFDRMMWWGLQNAASRVGGEDYGRTACNMLEMGGPDDGPELLRAVSQSLLESAGIPGEVRYDPGRRLLWLS